MNLKVTIAGVLVCFGGAALAESSTPVGMIPTDEDANRIRR